MRKTGISTSNPPAAASNGRLLLHLGPGLRQAIDPDDIYFVEAEGDDTRVRTRAARALRDVRPIGQIEPLLSRRGFVRTHRNTLVNPLTCGRCAAGRRARTGSSSSTRR